MLTWTQNRSLRLVMVATAAVAGALDSLAQEKVAKDRPPGARAARNNPRVERWKREAADYQVTELRILSQPLFRYESKSDGTLFAFVMATDPEALLLIDERPGDSGPAWHYAFARMSNHSLAAKRRDLVVWEVPVDTNDTDPAKPYFVRWDVGPRAQPAP
jgi:hypothetical protein